MGKALRVHDNHRTAEMVGWIDCALPHHVLGNYESSKIAAGLTAELHDDYKVLVRMRGARWGEEKPYRTDGRPSVPEVDAEDACS